MDLLRNMWFFFCDHNSLLSLKPPSNLEPSVNQFNIATPENSNDPEKVCSSKYYDIEEMHKIKIYSYLTKINCSPCFISMHVLLIKILMTFNISWIALKKFDIIAISETRITKQVSLSNNLNLNNYSFEFTPTETSTGGTLLYIANHLSNKCNNDLNIYKKMSWNLLLLKEIKEI